MMFRLRLHLRLLAPPLPIVVTGHLPVLPRSSYAKSKRPDSLSPSCQLRLLHTTWRPLVVKPFLLADIGEGTPVLYPSVGQSSKQLRTTGITEVQIIQWFVQEGAHVNQFDKLCEVRTPFA